MAGRSRRNLGINIEMLQKAFDGLEQVAERIVAVVHALGYLIHSDVKTICE